MLTHAKCRIHFSFTPCAHNATHSQPPRPDHSIHHQRVSYSEQFLFSLVYSLHYLLFYFVWLTFKRYLHSTTTFVLMHGIFVASLYVFVFALAIKRDEMRREVSETKQPQKPHSIARHSISESFSIHRFVDWEIVSRGASRCQTSVFMSLHCLASHQTKDVCHHHRVTILWFEFWEWNSELPSRENKFNVIECGRW